MSAPERVTLAEVRHVAALANLELTPAEEPGMQRDLNAILSYVAQLNALDTAGVEPMAQVSEILPLRALHEDTQQTRPTTPGPRNVANPALRQDVVVPSLDRAVVLAEAPETDGRFFKVPKVIER